MCLVWGERGISVWFGVALVLFVFQIYTLPFPTSQVAPRQLIQVALKHPLVFSSSLLGTLLHSIFNFLVTPCSLFPSLFASFVHHSSPCFPNSAGNTFGSFVLNLKFRSFWHEGQERATSKFPLPYKQSPTFSFFVRLRMTPLECLELVLLY